MDGYKAVKRADRKDLWNDVRTFSRVEDVTFDRIVTFLSESTFRRVITISIHRKNSLSKPVAEAIAPYLFIVSWRMRFAFRILQKIRNSSLWQTVLYIAGAFILRLPSSGCFIWLLYTEIKIRRAAGHFQFTSNLFRRPIADDFIECNRTIEPVPFSRTWAGVGNKAVFFFELLYLHRDKKGIENEDAMEREVKS